MTSSCKEIYKLVRSSNILAWKRRIDIVLEESEVIDHINGKVSKPTEGQALSEIMERDQRAQEILMKSIKDFLVQDWRHQERYNKLIELLSKDVIKKVISLRSDLHKLKVSKDKGLSS